MKKNKKAPPAQTNQEAQNQSKDKPLYRLNHFEGPLDLLLFLIRKNELDIHDVPISTITTQYLAYLQYSKGINLDEISEFYLMAATLIHIKSSKLLPTDTDSEEDQDDPRPELIQRLIEYEKFRKITDVMAKKQDIQADWIIERKKKQNILPFPDEKTLWEEANSWDLWQCFSKIMQGLSSENIINLWEEVSINEKITLIYEHLEKQEEFSFDEMLIKPQSLVEVISTFLALLELVKLGIIDVYQNRLFGDIKIQSVPIKDKKSDD